MREKIIRLIIFPLIMLYLELVFRMVVGVKFFSIDLVPIIFFTFLYGFIFSLITFFLKEKVWKALFFTFLIFTIIVYASQVTFYLIYDSIYTLTLTSGAFDAFEFVSFVFDVVLDNIGYYFLFLIPLFYSVFILKRKIGDVQFESKKLGIGLSLIICLYALSILTLPKSGVISSYDLYYNINSPSTTARRLGLSTAMRLDLSRVMFGFESNNELIEIDDEENDEEKQEKEKEITYNKLDIDFSKLIDSETSENVKILHGYFDSVRPTPTNEMTGIFEGKSLIKIVAESFDQIAIDEVITPTLYRLQQEGLNFTNFYTPIFVSTIDGEYMTKTGLLPKEGVWSKWHSRENSLPFVIGNKLSSSNYKTTAIHNGRATYYRRDESYPNMGYDKYYACGRGLDINCNLWPQSDLEMIQNTSHLYMNETPFYTYFLTMSGHLRHNLYNQMVVKNWSEVEELPYSKEVRSYMAQHIELDKAIELLLNDLENKGLLSETVITISSDHWPYGLSPSNLNERSSNDRTDFFERDRLPFIIWSEDIEGENIDLLGSSVDITPTLLNMFGLEYDSRLMIGKDIFSNYEPIVIFQNRSWITNNGRYSSSDEKFYLAQNKTVNDNYVNNINDRVSNYLQVSRMILEEDYYSTIEY